MKHKIICGDCIEVMEKMEGCSIDMIIFDPPYSRFSGSDGLKTNLGDYKILEIHFKNIGFIFKQLIKNTGSIFGFCDFRTYPCLYYGMFYSFQPANLIIWEKNFLGPGINFRPMHELIVYWKLDKTPSPINRNVTDIWKAPRVKYNEKKHVYQKPIKLIENMILNCSNEGDTILDPFLGYGTTMIVAEKLNRNSIGIEISKEYCELSYERLLSEVSQVKIDRELSIIKRIGF